MAGLPVPDTSHPPTLTLLHAFTLRRPPAAAPVDRFGTRLEERLLAYLALRPGVARRRNDIVATFWPEVETAKARKLLSLYLFKLKERLARSGVTDAIEDTRETLRLASAIRTDAQDFAELVLAGTVAHDPVQRAQHLQAAVAMYGDGLLPAYDYPWVTEQREQLEVLYRHAVGSLADLLDPSGGIADLFNAMPGDAWRGLDRLGRPDAGRDDDDAVPLFGGDDDMADFERLANGNGGDVGSDGGPDDHVAPDLATLAAIVRDAARTLNGIDRQAGIDAIDRRLPTLRAVLSRPTTVSQYPTVLGIAADLWRYWYATGRTAEGRTYLDHLLGLGLDAPRDVRAAALHASGTLANLEGDRHAGIPRLRAAAELWHLVGDDRALLSTLVNLALGHHDDGAYAEAQPLHGQAIRIARRLGEERSLARALYNAALTEIQLGHGAAARALLEERLALPLATKDPLLRGVTRARLASAAMLEGDRATAGAEATAALDDLATAPGADRRAEAVAQCVLGWIHLAEGRPADARTALTLSVEHARSAHDMGLTGLAMGYLAFAHSRLGEGDLAAQCTLNAVRLMRSAGAVDDLARFEAAIRAEGAAPEGTPSGAAGRREPGGRPPASPARPRSDPAQRQ